MDLLLALKAVREVSLIADPERPEKVAQSAWDEARGQVQGYGELPRAKRLTEQLGMGWAKVLKTAHEPENGHAKLLAHRPGLLDYQDWLTKEYIAFALASVAHRLGAKSISPGQYMNERELMLKEDHSRWLHGRQLWLPTEMQIRLALANASDKKAQGSPAPRRKAKKGQSKKRRQVPRTDAWNAALELAGLEKRAKPGGSKKGLAPTELLERCYEAHGTQPTSGEAVAFALANDISFSRTGTVWAEHVAAWKAARRARRLDVPQGPPPLKQRPDYTKDVGAGRPSERRRRSWGNIEDCIDYVVLYLKQVPNGEIASQNDYLRWASTQTVAPYNKAFAQHGGWTRVRALAQARLLREPNS